MRARRVVMAVWYLIAATPAPAIAAQIAAPRTKLVAQADFPCAQHACGCRTAEQCRLHCCCVHPARPAGADVSAQPMTVAVHWLGEAQCRGRQAEGTAGHALDPHVPLKLASLFSASAFRRADPGRFNVVRRFGGDALDKVPI